MARASLPWLSKAFIADPAQVREPNSLWVATKRLEIRRPAAYGEIVSLSASTHIADGTGSALHDGRAFGVVALGPLGYSGMRPTSRAGSRRRSKRLTLQSRCGPVARPVAPTSAMDWPCRTRSPRVTRIRERCRNADESPCPWSTTRVPPDRKHFRLGEGDHAAGRGLDLRAGRGRDVDPVVRLARFAVQDALRTVDPADSTPYRPAETVEEVGAGVVDLPCLGDQAGVRADSLELLLASRRDLVRRKSVDALDAVRAPFHGQHPPLVSSVRVRHRELRIRRCVPPESDEEPAVPRDPHRHALELDHRARRDSSDEKPALGVRTVQADAGGLRGDSGWGARLAGRASHQTQGSPAGRGRAPLHAGPGHGRIPGGSACEGPCR